jgi:hypothetical protein
MLVFTPKQIEELLNIIDKHHAMFVGSNIGVDFLSQQEKTLLKDAGIDIKKLKDKRGYVDEAFSFGILSQAIGDRRSKGMNYKDFKNFMQSKNYMPLTGREEAAIEHLKYQTYSDIKNLANKVKNDISTIIVDEDKGYRTKFDKVVSDAAIRVVEMRGSVADMVSEIGRKTGEWERNLGRIAEYTLHNAYEEGRAAQMEKESGGEEVYIYKDVYPGACKHCIRLYLTEGIGSRPIVFKLSELRANGSNVGKKAGEWKATLGSIHPYCRCSGNKLEKGYVWDEDSKSFVRGKSDIKSEKVRNRKKVAVKIGNETYMV